MSLVLCKVMFVNSKLNEMDESILMGFDNLKISAFSKYSTLTGDIHNVTIGPNRSFESPPASEKKAASRRASKEKQETSPISALQDSSFALKQALKDLETQRRDKVEEEVKKRQRKFEEFSKAQRSERLNQWLSQQQRFVEDMKEKEEKILDAIREYSSNKSNQNAELVKHYQELLQKKMLYEQQQEINKQKQRILNENIDVIRKSQIEFRNCFQDIIATIKTCTSNEDLKKLLGDDFKLLKILPEAIEEIIVKCKNQNVEEVDAAKALNIVNQIKVLKLKIQETVFKINNKKKEEEVKPPPVQKPPPLAIKETIPVIKVPTVQLKEQPPVTLEQYISPTNFKRYTEISQFLVQHTLLFKDLLVDDSLKQFRFDCKKAVNIPVNTITAVSANHLKDKFDKLSNLLSGKTIEVSDKHVNASRHPQGIPFCMDLLAQRFVLQGDLLVSSNPEAAFSYAAIIISLWNDFPEFGKLLLGYFYSKCPYLVPFYVPKTDSQTPEEHYISLGYQYKDGQVEKQDKFLKRMTGIMRLYFAILIAKPKRGQSTNPHNISNGWRFFVSILKLEPHLNITATALHVFLETVGFEMETMYGVQFKKLIQVLSDRFMPKLKNVDLGGPVSRLESLLREYREKGHFEKPNGVLINNFW